MINKDRSFSFFFEFFLIFLVLFSPFFYGSFLKLPRAVLQLTPLFLLAVFFLKSAFLPASKINYPSSLIFVIFFLGIIIFQLIPLPLGVLKIISAKTASLYRNFSAHSTGTQFRPLSLYPLATREELIKSLSLLSIFLVTINIFERKGQLRRMFVIIIIWGAALSFYGLVKRYFILSGKETLSFSTFGNRNHFSGYMVMIAPLCIGYALSCRDWAKKIVFWFLGSIIAGSILLSFSRGGVLSLVFSFILLAGLTRKGWTRKEKVFTAAALLSFIIFFIFLFGLGPLKNKFSYFWPGLFNRLRIAQDSLRAVKDFPFFGVGLGNFSRVFPIYKSFITPGVYYKYLHNDYLQLLLEAGSVASLFCFIFFYKTFKEILTKLRQRKDPFFKGLVLGGVCGLFGLLLHSCFDFNFHVPATAFLFWFILGLIYKYSYLEINHEGKKT